MLARVFRLLWVNQIMILERKDSFSSGGRPFSEPFPRMWYIGWWKNLIPFLQRFQNQVPLGILSESKLHVDLSFKYFFHKNLLPRWEWFHISFHRIFPPIPKLNKHGSFTCRAPLINGLMTVSQLTRCNFLWFHFPPFHRKYLRRQETWSIVDFGSKSMEDW